MTTTYPVTFTVDFPDRALDRLTSAFRIVVAIPILAVLSLLTGASLHYVTTHNTTSVAASVTAHTRPGQTIERSTRPSRSSRTSIETVRSVRLEPPAAPFLGAGQRLLCVTRRPLSVNGRGAGGSPGFPVSGCAPTQPMAPLGEMVAGHSPLHRALLCRDRSHRGGDHRLVCHPLHRTVSSWSLRLRGRGHAVE